MVVFRAICLAVLLLAVSSLVAEGQWVQYSWRDTSSLVDPDLFSTLADLEGDCMLLVPDPEMPGEEIEEIGRAVFSRSPGMPVILCSFRDREYLYVTDHSENVQFESQAQGVRLHDIQGVLWAIAMRIRPGSTIHILTTSLAASALDAMFDDDWTAYRMYLPEHHARHSDLQTPRGLSIAAHQWSDLLTYLMRMEIEILLTPYQPRSIVVDFVDL
jgi:hypothetical protein